MKYLLDTHAIIWALTEPQKLSHTAQELLADPYQDIVVSAVSFWEIALKFSLGKLDLAGYMPEEFVSASTATGFFFLDLSAEFSSSYHQLAASHHKDPFDRMLIWQAITYKYTLISDDEHVKKYQSEGLKVIW
ncbi:type II toxin-antitoxin system VapC family toxin [Dyadobacter bucti]|jgi:PIN domain nuclease of toxin-antitoxin system|uniref:type II toxin-antitoxin system VapC family toxin n=1 Tax=Dyadobacter bucti TaxID=2572203 RepID=UPI001107F583|nr:type II toxin-antitoxin system VapC family toxin [Dyadobacter bucti]